jgi:pyruvate dehydrogenase E2 component (dihydrolipoamide acetyltransferase)
MAEKLPMIALSPTMETGTIVKWRKQEGERVSSGDVVCEVETDKATMEYTATADGTLLKILRQEGEEAAVGDPIAILGEEGEDISNLEQAGEAASEKKKPEKKEVLEVTEEEQERKAERSETSEVPTEAEPARSSPLARKLSQQHGVDISRIKGSGPRGRVVEKDVERVLQEQEGGKKQRPSTPPAAELREESLPISEKRRVIARRLSESMFTAPHYYLRVAAIVDELLHARQAYNAQAAEKLSLNAFLVKLVAETLSRHPAVNASWTGEAIVRHGRVDVAVAVAQPDGLVTPVVRNCQRKGLVQIDRELRDLVDRARQGKLKPEEYLNSTFTITNLGALGIEEFTAIINPPNAAILAVGRIGREQVFADDGTVGVHAVVRLTLSCDHRLLDGVVAGAFLKDLKDLMEYPLQPLL